MNNESEITFFLVFFVSSVRLVELRRAALLAAGEVWKLQFRPKGFRSRLLRGWWRAQGRVCGGLKLVLEGSQRKRLAKVSYFKSPQFAVQGKLYGIELREISK